MKTHSQQDLAWAYQVVSRKEKVTREYRTAVLKMTDIIQTCGLAQAVAFAKAKAKAKEGESYKALMNDLKDLSFLKDDPLKMVLEAQTAEYMRLTRRTLLALGFLKRMVEAHYEKTEEDK